MLLKFVQSLGIVKIVLTLESLMGLPQIKDVWWSVIWRILKDPCCVDMQKNFVKAKSWTIGDYGWKLE